MKNNMSTLKKDFKVLKYVFKFCPNFIYYSILYVISSVVKSLSKLLLITKAIEEVMIQGMNLNILALAKSISLYLVLIILCSIINVWYEDYITQKNQLIYQKNIQHFIYEKVKHIDMESFDNPEFFNKFTRASNDSTYRGFYLFNSVMRIVVNVATAIAVGTFIVINDPLLIIIIVICAIANMIIMGILNKLWYKVYKDSSNEFRYKWYVSRTFYKEENAAEMKTTNIKELLKENYKTNCSSIEKKYKKAYRKAMGIESISGFFNVLVSQAGSYMFLTARLFKGMAISTFTSTINATFQFSNNITEALSLFTMLKEHSLYIDDFIWLINYKPVVETEKERLDIEFKDMDINNISFTYPNTNKFQIDNLSLHIKKGERIAIVGDNGGGKTTLMKLLLAFYNPTSGNILVNGLDYKKLDTRDIRNIYSIVFQDFKIYACTIAENVLMRRCKTEEDKELVINALRSVGLYEKIEKLDKGINTLVTKEFDQKGLSLSGGERQRLAIARVFASKKDIFILDEPTSSLDPISEEKINKLIIKEAKDKTMFIIAHRLSTVVDCDKIYLIRDGKIMESGTHEELIKLNGRYKQMFDTQKKLYERIN